jgi:hypothetical protein
MKVKKKSRISYAAALILLIIVLSNAFAIGYSYYIFTEISEYFKLATVNDAYCQGNDVIMMLENSGLIGLVLDSCSDSAPYECGDIIINSDSGSREYIFEAGLINPGQEFSIKNRCVSQKCTYSLDIEGSAYDSSMVKLGCS